MLAVTALLYVQGLDGVVTLMDGALLAAVFGAYLFYLYIFTKQADPVEETEEPGEVVILKVEETESEEEESYVSVDDEETLNQVFDIFKEKLKDEFNFADDE